MLHVVAAKYLIVTGATILSIGGHLLYALLFSTQTMLSIYVRAHRVIEAGLGMFFGVMGIRLITDRS